MAYQELDQFLINFPLGDILVKGGYGTVHASKEYVVKIHTHISECEDEINIESVFENTLREVNIMLMFNHVSIIRVEAYSFHLISGKFPHVTSYIAMKRGIPIAEALQKKDIGIHQVARDLLSAMLTFDRAGIVHNDIKVDNITFLDGHAKLIDFGISATSDLYLEDLNKKAERFFDTPIYTHTYQDPQILPREYISTKVELYAVQASLSYLEKVVSPIEWNSEEPFNLPALIQDLKKFPISERLSIEEILEKYSIIPFDGSIIEELTPQISRQCNQRHILVLFHWLTGLSSKLKAKTLFLAIHIFHRLYEKVNVDSNRLQLLGEVCLFLASCVHEYLPISIDDLVYASDNSYTSSEFSLFTIDMIVALEGMIITKTYWDFAQGVEDLINYYYYSLRCDYQPSFGRLEVYQPSFGSRNDYQFYLVPVSSGIKNDKNISVKILYQLMGRPNIEMMKEKISKEIVFIGGVNSPIYSSVPFSRFHINSLTFLSNESLKRQPGLFLYFYDQLRETYTDMSNVAYEIILNLEEGYRLLSQIVHFDIARYASYPFRGENINPFTARLP